MLEIAPSTVSRHLKALILVGLVAQEQQATTLICRVKYDVMHNLVDFLVTECCANSAHPPAQQLRRRKGRLTPIV